ncbi:MAG: hypothetical protein JW834_02315 [Candidatus Diapherotrites archaeon]|nr:hypothetical protein [Candidatus Diapherotrites archaeon]
MRKVVQQRKRFLAENARACQSRSLKVKMTGATNLLRLESAIKEDLDAHRQRPFFTEEEARTHENMLQQATRIIDSDLDFSELREEFRRLWGASATRMPPAL